MADQQNLNIPQLLAFLLISGLAIRWFFFTPSSSSTRTSSSAGGAHDSRTPGGRRVDESRVEQVQAMFPQLSRRDIIWDLMRNGGSVQATTERILSGRGLEPPPTSFQPPPPPSSSVPPSVPTSAAPAQPRSAHSDLITRYNLFSKISSAPEQYAGGVAASGHDSTNNTTGPNSGKASWSQNRNERQALMQRRREEMILQARRRMETKDKGKGVSR
ncbi:MAG: hypothetical protein M1837_006382 [Sclerophora amabilis]|nr:MAG: hypothetical protein M1837_006382 [Sclerophora amabilis]